MKKEFLTFLMLLLLIFSACRKSETSSSDSDSLQILGGSEQTQEAIDLITEANAENRIRKRNTD
ncbi:MAG: hypothetical protein ACR2L1_07160 [Pyrinomonadaceae bacterium]